MCRVNVDIATGYCIAIQLLKKFNDLLKLWY